MVFSAGACPLDNDGKVIHAGDIAGQTQQSLANLMVAFEDADCTQADIVKTTIFVEGALSRISQAASSPFMCGIK